MKMKKIRLVLFILLLTLSTAAIVSAQYSVGDIVTLGQYEQDNDPGSGTEPIEWLVLSVDSNQALLISRYTLETRPYHDQWVDVTWENSSLRGWLNNEFFNTAFNSDEQKQIVLSDVINQDTPGTPGKGGNNTQDRIFILSAEEANTLFRSDEERQGQMTETARAKGAREARWWLRTPGGLESQALLVDPGGRVSQYGDFVNAPNIQVRPALRLQLSGSAAASAPAPSAPAAGNGPKLYIAEAGDTCESIVEKFGVDYSLFMLINNMTECNISAGSFLVIPAKGQQLPAQAPTATQVLPTATRVQPTATLVPPAKTPAPARQIPQSTAEFKISETGTLTKYTGTSTHVVIPDGVTAIDSFAFGENTTMKSVVIPDSVKVIYAYAFSKASGLESVTIPGSVVHIGDSAFYDCSSLSSVTIGDGVTFIGGDAFEYTAIRSISIPGSVFSIGDDAFYDCKKLQTVVISEGVRSIGNYAFMGSDNIQSVTLPASINTIGQGAFSGMKRSIFSTPKDSYADHWLDVGLSYLMTDKVNGFEIDAAGLLRGYTGSEIDLVIPSNVRAIDSFAFDDNTQIRSVTIPGDIVTIGMYAFSGCTALETVDIQGSVQIIGRSAFSNCSSLRSIMINEGPALIDENAFYKCENITSISTGPIQVIAADAFASCSNLFGEFSFLDGIRVIEGNAFRNTPLTSVLLPETIEFIGDNAFPAGAAVTTEAGTGSSSTASKPKASVTHTPMPSRTPVPATKTPTPYPTYDRFAGYVKYYVTGSGLYGFQVRPRPTTGWFYKEQYQHAVHDGDIVYFTGTKQYGPGYNNDNIEWYSIITEDGFTGWLPAYILKQSN